MLIFTAPDGKGSSPVAITRKSPVDIVIEPITIATRFDCLWMPISLLVFAD